jgi:hypothetical protein
MLIVLGYTPAKQNPSRVKNNTFIIFTELPVGQLSFGKINSLVIVAPCMDVTSRVNDNAGDFSP